MKDFMEVEDGKNKILEISVMKYKVSYMILRPPPSHPPPHPPPNPPPPEEKSSDKTGKILVTSGSLRHKSSIVLKNEKNH